MRLAGSLTVGKGKSTRNCGTKARGTNPVEVFTPNQVASSSLVFKRQTPRCLAGSVSYTAAFGVGS